MIVGDLRTGYAIVDRISTTSWLVSGGAGFTFSLVCAVMAAPRQRHLLRSLVS
jgi:cellobiose-specific phosphotransferase system component IIC